MSALHTVFSLAAAALLISAATPAVSSAADQTHLYVTWAGSEPDKGASAWYIKRHVDRNAVFEVHAHGSIIDRGIAFDTPFARYRRIHNASTMETLLREHPTSDPAIQKMARLTHDIEINLWRPRQFPESHVLEGRIKEIDAHFGGAGIPIDCFIPFFDGVYRWLAATTPQSAGPPIPSVCMGEQK